MIAESHTLKMFTRSLFNSHANHSAATYNPVAPAFSLTDYGYGKEGVHVFQLKKDGPVHSIKEFKVNTHLRLRSHKEYYDADNSDVVGSDEQESSIYIHAKKYGLTSPEEFALSLSEYFLKTYDQVMASNVSVEEIGWARLGEMLEGDGFYKNKPHNHAFMKDNNCKRFCEVVRKKDGKGTRDDDDDVLLIGGISGLRILKTAQAPFTGYIRSSLATEGDQPDRILCTEINARWQYRRISNIDFAQHWFRVRDLILKAFAGDPEKGVITTSVQYVTYAAERAILDAMPEIQSVSITLPNYKNFPYDFSKFPPVEPKVDAIISNPYETPIGIGYAQLDRKDGNTN